MAYVFNNINSMMGQSPDQSNIFAQGGQNANQPTGQQDVSNISPTQAPSGSGSGSSGSNQSPKTSNVQKAQSMVGDSAIYSKNQSATPQLTQNFQGQESNIGQKLQDEANSYMTTQQPKGESNVLHAGETDSDIASGNYGAIASKLNAGPAQADQFASNVDTTVPHLQDLNSQAGLKGLFFNQGNETYGGGLAALDASLLGQNQAFKQQRGQLFDTQNQIQANQAANNQNLQGQAQQSINARDAEVKQGIKNRLSYNQGLINQSAAQRANDYNSQVKALQGNTEWQGQQEEAAKQEVLKGLQASGNQGLIDYIGKGVDVPNAGNYFNYAGPATGSQMYSAPEAQQFNQIQALLGNGGAQVQTGTLGDMGTFNKTAYEKALQDIAGTRFSSQQDAANQAAVAAEAKRREDLYSGNYEHKKSPDILEPEVQFAKDTGTYASRGPAIPGTGKDIHDYTSL